ncbi:50S ribosomal protein L6 [uncultured archaeon]|nr:50S ribosomal protein L6 [uncultured archaeon]
MYDLELPKDIKAKISEDGTVITLSGKLGSTSKIVNRMLIEAKVEGSKIVFEPTPNGKLAKKADLAARSLVAELKSASVGVEQGVERDMKILFAHFPISVDIKAKEVHIKNIFGEKFPRVAKIVGDTKVTVKGQDVHIAGVDEYDVGQTAANLHRLSSQRNKDGRVFQDGIYHVHED